MTAPLSPPELAEIAGIVWTVEDCPACGAAWWTGRDDGDQADDPARFELTDAAFRQLARVCPDCRGVGPEARRPNRAARRARPARRARR